MRDAGLVIMALANAHRNGDRDGAALLLDSLGLVEARSAVSLAARMLAEGAAGRPGGVDLLLRVWRARERE